MNQSFELSKSKVRDAVKNVYSIQKLRVANGNRISQSFMQQAGVDPGMKKEEMDKEVVKMLKRVLGEYDRVTDAYVDIFQNKGRITKSIEYLGEELALIRSDTDYQLVSIYMGLLKQETDSNKLVKKFVSDHPMWDVFFKDITGCGPLMSAVCIAYLDPYKARHVSSFWKYAGLDVVYDEDGFDSDSKILIEIKIDPKIITAEMAEVGFADKETIELTTPLPDYNFSKDDPTEEDFQLMSSTLDIEILPGMFVLNTYDNGNKVKDFRFWVYAGDNIWYKMNKNIDKTRIKTGGYVGRSKKHVEDYLYTDKNGEEKMKKGITYNPFLKTKLVGVLADSFLKCPGSHYEKIYRDYRARLDNDLDFKTYSAEHKMRMSKRYCIKMFLRDLWISWRTFEGLPVSEPYEVSILGNKPHGFNYNTTVNV